MGYYSGIDNAMENDMTYAEFKKAYTDAFTRMVSYKVGEVGSDFYSENLADLSDAYPEFEATLESELEAA